MSLGTVESQRIDVPVTCPCEPLRRCSTSSFTGRDVAFLWCPKANYERSESSTQYSRQHRDVTSPLYLLSECSAFSFIAVNLGFVGYLLEFRTRLARIPFTCTCSWYEWVCLGSLVYVGCESPVNGPYAHLIPKGRPNPPAGANFKFE